MQIHVIRSAARKKSLSLEISPSGEVLVRAPLRASEAEIRKLIASHAAWIEERLRRRAAENAAAACLPPLTGTELRRLADDAAAYFPPLVSSWASALGVTCGRISIRNQKTRWGSCSAKGNLNFNCLLMLAPPEVRTYVVVHELCHRKEMNHSARFWQAVRTALPDYEKQRAWLREHGPALLKRMQGG